MGGKFFPAVLHTCRAGRSGTLISSLNVLFTKPSDMVRPIAAQKERSIWK
ncbi:hypothetical protein APS_0056 [Acetobacter pasteurianus subsp. pasteurianus LMG 1262 = NBRC 106471]|nr:hypothetical protein APS_0056 [Acetobacter pasteurianus subsp. pasteurianus LMG 1262 = NBRC 106471]